MDKFLCELVELFTTNFNSKVQMFWLRDFSQEGLRIKALDFAIKVYYPMLVYYHYPMIETLDFAVKLYYPMLRSSSTMPPMKRSCMVIISFHALCFGFRNDREIGGMESAHDSFIWSLSWHPLGHILCSGSNDHTRWETPPPLTSQSLTTLHLTGWGGLVMSGK